MCDFYSFCLNAHTQNTIAICVDLFLMNSSVPQYQKMGTVTKNKL